METRPVVDSFAQVSQTLASIEGLVETIKGRLPNTHEDDGMRFVDVERLLCKAALHLLDADRLLALRLGARRAVRCELTE